MHNTNVTRPAKTQHNRTFSNSSLSNNYNLLSQIYGLAKFQPDMPITF